MGVYHFMGLGRSVGTVTGPLSYLAMRFERWNSSDQRFFDLSGEVAQRQGGEKVGDVEALVLFTTAEVYSGNQGGTPYDFIDNDPGHYYRNETVTNALSMREEIHKRLPRELRKSANGRPVVDIYWCEVDRGNLLKTFQRTATVLKAAKAPGTLGKEVWVNLTGGNNVLNLSLQLAAGLTGHPARFYYVQAADPTAEKCLRYTGEENYWVDLPLLPIRAHEPSRRLVEIVEKYGILDISRLLAEAIQEHWRHFDGEINMRTFKDSYVRPLVQQGLLALGKEDENRLVPGRNWNLLKPYFDTIDQISNTAPNLSHLDEAWFHREKLEL